MKTSLLLISLSVVNMLFAQSTEQCASKAAHLRHMEQNPALLQKQAEIEAFTESWVSRHQRGEGRQNVVTIPVVVHVVHAGEAIGSGSNISDAQIYSQIDALNEDFRLLNADSLPSNHPFWVYSADALIEFCLAQQNEFGQPTNGIDRVNGYVAFGYSDWDVDEFDDIAKPATQWDPDSYLNLWTLEINSNGPDDGTLGWASFPDEHGQSHDGVAIIHTAFGTIGSATYPNDLGRTGTHEIGHYFNLLHIWGDDFCGNDLVSDTPPAESDNSGCPSFPWGDYNSCGSNADGEMYMNYMDYTDDDCMNMFTFGQASRMDAAISGPRAALLSSNACSTPSGIAESEALIKVKISPNPADDIVNIRLNKEAKNVTIAIHNIVGQVVQSNAWNSGKIFLADVSKLSPGMYFVVVTADDNSIKEQIIIK